MLLQLVIKSPPKEVKAIWSQAGSVSRRRAIAHLLRSRHRSRDRPARDAIEIGPLALPFRTQRRGDLRPAQPNFDPICGDG
jgi:hypothetical protein